MALFRIVYSSTNCIPGTPDQVRLEIATILQTSRDNNQAAGITGALLFNGNGFAQVLEGPMDAVETTFERIQCDCRHSNVVLLSNEHTAARTFSDWSMAYADPALVRAGGHEPIAFHDLGSDAAGAGTRIVQALQLLLTTELA